MLTPDFFFTLANALALPAWAGPGAAPRYAALVAGPDAAAHLRGIFHPPTLRS